MNTLVPTKRSWAVPILIYGAALAVYLWLASLQKFPLVQPDEIRYGHMARSLADGHGFTWYGEHESYPMGLYILALTPSWLVASGEHAYGLAKATGAIFVCLVVMPVWVLARRLMPAPVAAIPTVLVVAGTWMLTAGGLLTENLAFPLTTAALVAAVIAISDESTRWSIAALVLAMFATLARAQVGVLVVIFLAALLLLAATSGDWRRYLERHRRELIVLGVLVAAAAAVALSGAESTLGPYKTVPGYKPKLDDVSVATGKQWLALVTMSGFLPVAAWLAVVADRSLWRDRRLGPLLAVTSSTIVVLLLETGFFGAGLPGLRWGIERYVAYAVPLLLVLLVASIHLRVLNVRWLAIAGAAVTLSLLAEPHVREAIEQRATWVTGNLGDDFGLNVGTSLALASAVVIGGAIALVARARPRVAAYGVGALLAVLLVAQSQAAWRWQTHFSEKVRAEYPHNLSWVDANSDGGVSRFYVYQNSYLFNGADVFNSSIEQDLVPARRGTEPPPLGPFCVWSLDERGTLLPPRQCGPVRRYVWNDDAYVRVSFHDGQVVARDSFLGQLIRVPPEPRLRSVIRMPCQRATLITRNGSPRGIPKDLECPPNMSVFLWVDSPGKLELTFRGGTREQRVAYQGRTWTIPPRATTTVTVPVTTRTANLTLDTGWDRTVGTTLTGATFVSRGQRASLL